MLSVFHDITVRRQAEERERRANQELARSQAELRKKNEMMEDDLRMAHEIQQAILPQQYPAFPPTTPRIPNLGDHFNLVRECKAARAPCPSSRT